jgi:hypothetical protein
LSGERPIVVEHHAALGALDWLHVSFSGQFATTKSSMAIFHAPINFAMLQISHEW